MKFKLTGLLFLVVVAQVHAQSIFAINGVAIRGFDPVAYFSESKPVEGSTDFSLSWQGTQWHFKDKTNLELFRQNPEKYAPQYGGYCAYGVSEDHKSPTEPSAFTIVNDKLYLNYSLKVKERWIKNRDERIVKADGLWITLKEKKD